MPGWECADSVGPSSRPAGRTKLLTKGCLALALLMVASGLACSLEPEPPKRIILIVVDTLRRDALSCYGGLVQTPNIDNLAAKGRASSSLLSSFHQTSMSMGAIFTGHTPSLESGRRNQILGWNGRTWCGLARFADATGEPGCIPQKMRTLGQVLHDAGYWTAAVVTNHLLFRPAGFDRGFDRWVELADRSSVELPGQRREVPGPVGAPLVNRIVEKTLTERPSDRFFLYVHYMDVHDYRLWRAPYPGMVKRVDQALGELLSRLEDQGLLEDAVVIFTSDHGEKFSEQHLVAGGAAHKGNPSFEELIRVPLIISPGRYADEIPVRRGQDLFALIARIAGVPVDLESELQPGELFLSEMHWQTYRRGRWKSYRRRKTAELYLADLEEDPGELHNAADRFPAIVARHSERMDSLTRSLAAKRPATSRLTEEDRRRLKALGYLE